jgi:hypothetical protein
MLSPGVNALCGGVMSIREAPAIRSDAPPDVTCDVTGAAATSDGASKNTATIAR